MPSYIFKTIKRCPGYIAPHLKAASPRLPVKRRS